MRSVRNAWDVESVGADFGMKKLIIIFGCVVPLWGQVTFKATGSSVNRNVLDKLRDAASIKDFGAVADWNGATGTDNTTTIQAAFTYACANGTSLFIPDGQYKITGLITCTIVTSKGIRVYAGPNAIIVNKGTTNGAFKFAGTPHTTSAIVLLQGFKILNGTSGTSAFGVQIFGVAGPAVNDLAVYGATGNPTVGLQLTAAQKGYVKGGQIYGAETCLLLEADSGISSNAVDVSGMDLACTVSGHTVTGADDGSFHGNHVTSSTYGSHVNANNAGKYTIGPDNHYESITSKAVWIENGRARVVRNSMYDVTPIFGVSVTGASNVTVEDNQNNGDVEWTALAYGGRLWGNMINGSITDTSTNTLWNCNNYNISGAFIPCTSGSSLDPTPLFSTTNLGGVSVTSSVDNIGLNATSTGTGGHHWGVYSAGGGSSAGQGALLFYDVTANNSHLVLPVDGGVQLQSTTQPTCNAAHRGVLFYLAQGAGVKDKFVVCLKDSTDTYAWYDMVPLLP